MKKTFHLIDLITSATQRRIGRPRGARFLCILYCAFLVPLSFTASQWGWASIDLDKKFQLEAIGVLKSWDNVDGLFSEYVSAAYAEYFSTQSRFVMNDLSKAETAIARFKVPYQKVIYDPEILSQIARSTRSESMLRTKIVKDHARYSFTVDWLHAPQMELMATLVFFLEEPSSGPLGMEAIIKGFHAHLPELISQVPFLGHVTGRDAESVTLNIGSHGGLSKGALLSIGTLEAVKKHPLLNSIVDWQLTPVGEVIVEEVEDSVAFCKIVSEVPGKEISRYQKVTQMRPAAIPPPPLLLPLNEGKDQNEMESHPSVEEEHSTSFVPNYGWISGGLSFGSYSWEYNSRTESALNTGGGMPLGGKIQSELWFTRSWFSNVDLGYSFWNFTQKAAATGVQTPVSLNGGVSGSSFSTKFNLGYSYLLSDDLTGSRLWLKLGYKTLSYRLPSQVRPEFTGSTSLGAVFLGSGGSFSFLENWGAFVDFSFGLLNSASVTGLTGTVSGASYIGFSTGGSYILNPRTRIRVGLDFESVGTDLSTGALLNQKTVTFGPSLLYYF